MDEIAEIAGTIEKVINTYEINEHIYPAMIISSIRPFMMTNKKFFKSSETMTQLTQTYGQYLPEGFEFDLLKKNSIRTIDTVSSLKALLESYMPSGLASNREFLGYRLQSLAKLMEAKPLEFVIDDPRNITSSIAEAIHALNPAIKVTDSDISNFLHSMDMKAKVGTSLSTVSSSEVEILSSMLNSVTQRGKDKSEVQTVTSFYMTDGSAEKLVSVGTFMNEMAKKVLDIQDPIEKLKTVSIVKAIVSLGNVETQTLMSIHAAGFNVRALNALAASNGIATESVVEEVSKLHFLSTADFTPAGMVLSKHQNCG
jgi:hypothetical protein